MENEENFFHVILIQENVYNIVFIRFRNLCIDFKMNVSTLVTN